jgi:hypothetical protein
MHWDKNIQKPKSGSVLKYRCKISLKNLLGICKTQTNQYLRQITTNISKHLPIFVTGIANIISLTTLLGKIAKNECDIKVLNNTQIKIQLKTSIKYISIVKEL